MAPRERATPALAGIALACVAVLVVLAGACASGSSEVRPSPALATSPAAGSAFEAIREGWRTPDRVNPATLRGAIESFLSRYPSDGLVPVARIYLALVAMRQEDFATADRQLALTAKVEPGAARDLWTVASARRLRLRGEPESAMEVLRPLIGKSVDPIGRAVFQEELTLSALATGRDYEAISYMDAWLRATTEDEKEQTTRGVTTIVERLPRDVLVGALQAMRAERTTYGYGVEIERILAERLVVIATSAGDAELARMLLDPDAGAIVVTGEAGVELGELATSRRGLNVVGGRTIGLLLPTDSPGLRDESADVLRGVMWALGLPRGVRSASAPPQREAAGSGAPSMCAPPEPAPALAEPAPGEGLRLVTRDDAGSADRTEVSLDELAGEGAAVVVAGLDEQTAERALHWGENHQVPVVALVPPRSGESPGKFGFVLGEARANVVKALGLAAATPSTSFRPRSGQGRRADSTSALPPVAGDVPSAGQPWVPIVDASELPLYPAEGGRLGDLTLLPPVSCDIPAARAGDPRFPIAQWEMQRTRAWLVSGSPACAHDVLGELSKAGARGVVGLTLEAAALLPHGPALRVLVASAGLIPESSATEARDDELRRFSATLGHATWWTALGRDAATLARVAVGRLPTDEASAPSVVAQRRVQSRDALAAARARLWSTDASGWSDAHTIRRTVCAIPAVESSGR
jgi:hypothetical protein